MKNSIIERTTVEDARASYSRIQIKKSYESYQKLESKTES